MTVDEVRAAKETLEAEGLTPSYNAIVARIGGSKRDVMHFMQELNALETTAVTTLEPPAPEAPHEQRHLSSVVEPAQTPLSLAREARDQAHQAEHALGVHEQGVKRERQALEQTVLRWEASAARQTSDAFDLAARREMRAARDQLLQVESQRLAIHQHRRAAHLMLLEAADQFDTLHGQACRWLCRLRATQRQVQAGNTAQARGDAREEYELALTELAHLVGLAEAQRCGEDATSQPDWLKG